MKLFRLFFVALFGLSLTMPLTGCGENLEEESIEDPLLDEEGGDEAAMDPTMEAPADVPE